MRDWGQSGVPQAIVSSIGYQPFELVNATTCGNGIVEARSYDLDSPCDEPRRKQRPTGT